MILIFTVYIFSRIFKKRELSKNIYNAKISTVTVLDFRGRGEGVLSAAVASRMTVVGLSVPLKKISE